MLATTRREAIHFGLTRYTTGKTCIHGHASERYAASGACVECTRSISLAIYAATMAASAKKREVRNALAETTFRCFQADAPAFTETVVAVTLARHPKMVRGDVVGRWKPFDYQVGTALYKFRVEAEDVGILREVALAMVSARSAGNGEAARARALGQVAPPDGHGQRDNQAGEWTFK